MAQNDQAPCQHPAASAQTWAIKVGRNRIRKGTCRACGQSLPDVRIQ